MHRLVLLSFLLLSVVAQAADHVLEGASVPIQTRGVSEDMNASVEEVINAQLTLAADTEVSAALADDLAFFVRRHYLAQGFLGAAVQWQLVDKSIVLVVDESVQQHVGEVSFDGNPGLKVEDLKRYLLRPTRERIGRFAKTTPYVEKEVQAGLDLVQRYLLSQGYVDATVDVPEATRSNDGTTALRIGLHPGEQWHVGKVELHDAPPLMEDMLREEVQALRGQAVNEARIENMRRQIEGEMQALGYFKASATSDTTRGSNKTMDVIFTAVPGPLHQVTELQIDPTFSRGAVRLITSAFKPALDKVYDSRRMELSYGRIVDTAIFEHLEMEPKAIGDDALALCFSGQLAKKNTVSLSGGFDTFLGVMLGVEYKNVNVFDTGGMFRVKVLGTQLGLLAGIQWKNPAIFNSAYALSVEFMPETFTFEGYTRHTGGLRVALSRDFTKHLSAEVYLGSSINTVASDTLTSSELGPEDYTLGNGGVTLIYEARDNPVAPTRGWFASATLEEGVVTGGSVDVAYTRTNIAASWYRPLGRKWRTAVGVQFASLISGEDVGFIPIELRNYNGGAKGVRSFAERELGPRAVSDGTPLGGTQSQTISGEISYEIVKNLEIAGFVDAGSLSADKGSVLPKFDDIRFAAGVGLRYKLPFGPLRVDYGVNLDRRTGEDFGALHVGFGFAF
jgi:outer membrane protein assembly complex protein YaeT